MEGPQELLAPAPSSPAPAPAPSVERQRLLWGEPWQHMPSRALWAVLNPEEREQIVQQVLWFLSKREERDLRRGMAESHFHKAAGDDMAESLGHFFRVQGKAFFVEANLPVLYPRRAALSPDVMVVAQVRPGARGIWIVADEGKGPDLVIEVFHRGNQKKDYKENVKKYAKLGIHEYFIFNLGAGKLEGHRLLPQRRRQYQALQSDAEGRFHSAVLDLDLRVEEGQVRFYQGQTRLPLRTERDEEVTRVLQQRAEHIEQERQRAERAEQERQRAEQERQRAEQERQRAEQERQRTEQVLRAAILDLCELLGLEPSPAQRRELDTLDTPALEQLRLALKHDRRFPG